MYCDSRNQKDGWVDNLTEVVAEMDEDHMRSVYAQFNEGLRQGRSIADMAGEFCLSGDQCRKLQYRIKNGRRNTKAIVQ